MNELKNGNRLAYLQVVSSMLIFGTVGIVRRGMALPSAFVAASRGFIGCAVILLFMLIMRRKPSLSAMKANALPLILSGVFIGINWIFLFESYRYTTVATATLCYYMAPVFVVVFSPLILGERAGIVKILSVLVAVLGMVLVCEPWAGGFSEESLLGIVFALLAAAFYAAVTVTNKKLCGISSIDRTLAQLLVAASAVLPYSLAAETVTKEMFTPNSVLLLILLGALHTGLSYILFFSSIEKLPAVSVSLFGYIDPVFAVILSAAVLEETMSALAVLGAVVIVLSMAGAELYEVIKAGKKKK